MMRLMWQILVVGLLVSQLGCEWWNNSGGSSEPGKGGERIPRPCPRPATVISRLEPFQRDAIKNCIYQNWLAAKADTDPEKFDQMVNEIGPAYVMTCLMKTVLVTESDRTPQFERDFINLFKEIQ